MATRAHYEQKLRNAYENIFRMGISAKNALEKASSAFRNGDKELARKVKEEDAAIDRQQLNVDTQIITLIATEHPVAQDLREIVSSLKIAVELERFADHAAHLAKAVLKLGKRPPATYIECGRSYGRNLYRDARSCDDRFSRTESLRCQKNRRS